MDLESVVVTGATRGIGLELVRQLVHLPNPPKYVFATYRSEGTTQELKNIRDEAKLSEVVLVKMDVTNVDEIRAARRTIEGKLGENGLTLLINNAGNSIRLPFPDLTEQNLLHHYPINAVGPIMVFQEMLPLLEKAADRKSSSPTMQLEQSRAAVLNISSALGSVTNTGSGIYKMTEAEAIGYKMSKAALNIGMRVIASQLEGKGILVVLMCPGWVKTALGTQMAELEVEDSISAILKTLSQLNEKHHGAYMDRNGKTIPF